MKSQKSLQNRRNSRKWASKFSLTQDLCSTDIKCYKYVNEVWPLVSNQNKNHINKWKFILDWTVMNFQSKPQCLITAQAQNEKFSCSMVVFSSWIFCHSIPQKAYRSPILLLENGVKISHAPAILQILCHILIPFIICTFQKD